jgi:hypothetical protein
MNPVIQLALAKVIADKDAKIARGGVNSGTHLVDMTVRISGRMTVGEDYDTAPTVSIPLKETMALLLHRMGFQRDKAIEILREVMSEAIDLDGKGQGALLAMPFINDAMAMVENDVIANLPRQNRKGVVKAYLAVETHNAVNALA